MEPSPPAVPAAAQGYRLPSLLQDIRLLDLLELSGTTRETGRLLQLSQPTVSRRYRALAEDFGLTPNRRRQMGCCYGTSATMRLLRLGSRTHRLTAGVARLGADVILQPMLAAHRWLLPAPTRFRALESWLELVRQGVLDGALVSGLEFAGDGPPECPGLELLPLGDLALELAMAIPGDLRSASVLVPNRAVAQGLQLALMAQGLSLRVAGNTCQTPQQWLRRLARAPLAMPLPALDPAHWWQPLHRLSLGAPLRLPLWLVLPQDWRRQPLLVHTAERLAAPDGPIRGQAG